MSHSVLFSGTGLFRERFGQCPCRVRNQQETAAGPPETGHARLGVIAETRVVEHAVDEADPVFTIVTRFKPDERKQTTAIAAATWSSVGTLASRTLI
ncbi:MAG: hypothetical protein ACYCRH_05420 [Acidiferrobacteraceae bacterium]